MWFALCDNLKEEEEEEVCFCLYGIEKKANKRVQATTIMNPTVQLQAQGEVNPRSSGLRF